MSSPSLPLLSPCPPPHRPLLKMPSSPLMSPTLPKTRVTRSSVELSPLSWAQYLGESLPTSSKNNETELQKMKRMQKLFRTWRDKQIHRARSRRQQRFV